MSDDDKQRRERAYWLWENEGRPEGRHDNHWTQAGEQDVTDHESEDVTKTNQEADQDFAGGNDADRSAIDIKTPSAISPD